MLTVFLLTFIIISLGLVVMGLGSIFGYRSLGSSCGGIMYSQKEGNQENCSICGREARPSPSNSQKVSLVQD